MFSGQQVGKGDSLMDSLKPMLMTMFAINQTGGHGGQQSSPFSMIYGMIMIGIIDQLMKLMPYCVGTVQRYVERQTKQVAESISISTSIDLVTNKAKTASIVLNITQNGPVNGQQLPDIGIAVLDHITNHENTQAIETSTSTGVYILNTKSPIQIGFAQDDIWCIMINKERSMTVDGQTNTPATIKQTIEIYSFSRNMDYLRQFLNKLQYDYTVKTQNKLGSNIYYFNELPVPPVMQVDGTIDYSKSPPYLVYNMKPFFTYKRLSNMFGPEIDRIRSRVSFFKNNRKWYEDKGIPYSLGILMSGQHGSGKTSLIKCLANELGRHVFSVQFHDGLTKQQFDNLFFNETVTIVNNMQSETYKIPLDKRIYVFEDVDCQSKIVLDRELMAKEGIIVPDEPSPDFSYSLPELGGTVMSSFGASAGSFNTPHAKFDNTYVPPKLNPDPNSLQPLPGKFPKQIPKTHNKHQQNTPSAQSLTLSYVLNVLDGILEIPGRVVIMSANFPEMLDKALIRPGRIDVQAHFTKCSHQTAIEMLEHFYDVKLSADEIALIQSTEEYKWFPAELHRFMFENFYSYQDTLQALVGGCLPISAQPQKDPPSDPPSTYTSSEYDILEDTD